MKNFLVHILPCQEQVTCVYVRVYIYLCMYVSNGCFWMVPVPRYLLDRSKIICSCAPFRLLLLSFILFYFIFFSPVYICWRQVHTGLSVSYDLMSTLFHYSISFVSCLLSLTMKQLLNQLNGSLPTSLPPSQLHTSRVPIFPCTSAFSRLGYSKFPHNIPTSTPSALNPPALPTIPSFLSFVTIPIFFQILFPTANANAVPAPLLILILRPLLLRRYKAHLLSPKHLALPGPVPVCS